MDKRELETQLESARQKMIRSGVENGLQNPKTIRLSKQLDRIMNQFGKKAQTSKDTEEDKTIL